MNHSINPNGQSPRVADYFVVVGTTDELKPLVSENEPIIPPTCLSSDGKKLSIQFEPSITDQYPLVESRGSPFPSGVPLFCYPNALEIYTESRSPSFFSFVQTSESGAHILGCCLMLYEPITDGAREALVKAYESCEDKEGFAAVMKGRLLVPKCLCVISTWPFIDAFKKILCQLYRISLSPSVVPLERYICNFLDDIPAPPPGRVAINYYLGDLAVSFRCPPANMPHVWNSFPVDPLFECLDLANVLTVFSAAIVERQIVFVSSQLSLLTTCAEVVTSFMYPLRWSHVYIPILPKALLGVLAAPVPFMVGVHADFLSSSDCSIPEEAVVVFIDDNRIELGSLGPPPILPEGRGRKLQAALLPLVSPTFTNRLSPWKTARLVHFDSAFNMSVRPDRANGTLEQGKSNIDDKALREVFLKFFVAIMKNYRKYLIYPTKEIPNPLINFQQSDFISDHPSDWGEFLRAVLPTQAFCQFCDARISSSSLKDADIRFFDESIEAKFNRYTFRFFSVDTPFLNDQSSKHVKTIVTPAPNLEGLPGYRNNELVHADIWTPTSQSSVLSVLASPEGSNESHASTSSAVKGLDRLRLSNSNVLADDGSVELSARANSSSSIHSDLALRHPAPETNGSNPKTAKKEEPVTYVYDNFPRLKPELYALPREGYDATISPYQQHTKKELRALKANPYTAAPLKSNDAINDLFSSKLKRIPRYKHKLQGFNDGMNSMLFGSASPAGAKSKSSSWFRSTSSAVSAQRNFARRGSGGIDSSFSETATLENANACTHNAFLTLLCFVISKNKYLPAVRRAPPATTKLIDAYGKGISNAVRGSTVSYSGSIDEDGGTTLRRTFSASLSASITKGGIRRSTSKGEDDIRDSGSDGKDFFEGRHTIASLNSSNNNIHLPDAVYVAADYDSADEERDSSKGFKHMSDNIREETFVASKAGLKMAFEVLYLMTDKGLPADELTYRSLAECCAVCGDGHCAIDLLEDMLYWGYLPDPDITSSVVQAMLHSSIREQSYSSEVDIHSQSISHKYGDKFVTAKDVLDAVNANQLNLLRERLEARFDDDVHTYASKNVSRRSPPHGEPNDIHTSHKGNGHAASTPVLKSLVSKESLTSFDGEEEEHSKEEGSSPNASFRNKAENVDFKIDVFEDPEVSKVASSSALHSPTKKINATETAASNSPKKRKKTLYLDEAVVPASSRLTTQILLADRILDMQFPELEINLRNPFGTFCPDPKCGKGHSLDQLREGWNGVDPNKYTTKCFHCSREFVPRFTVHSSCNNWLIEDADFLSDELPANYGKGSNTLLWCELLSPWVLRKELLMILVNDGIDRVLSPEFRKPIPSNNQNSVIFWNMIVAFRACGLPYTFMISETLSTAFLVPLGDPMG